MYLEIFILYISTHRNRHENIVSVTQGCIDNNSYVYVYFLNKQKPWKSTKPFVSFSYIVTPNDDGETPIHKKWMTIAVQEEITLHNHAYSHRFRLVMIIMPMMLLLYVSKSLHQWKKELSFRSHWHKMPVSWQTSFKGFHHLAGME